MTKTATNDPWLDDDAKVDFTVRAEDKELAELATEPHDTPTYNAEDFEVEDKPGESLLDYLQRAVPDAEISVPDKLKAAAEKIPEAVAPTATEPEPAPAGKSEVHPYPDGSSLTVEKTSKGWSATLAFADSAIKPEVFYGATKDEMWQNVAAGKINATKKIREQNKQIKLVAETAAEPVQQTVERAERAAGRELTADEVFEIRTAMESNPDLAFTKWFELKFNRPLAQTVEKWEKGGAAADTLDAEAEARDFVAAHPDYCYVGQEGVNNRFNMTARLSAKFLKQTTTVDNQLVMEDRLIAGGYWTNKNLSEAYDDLNESGLLEFAPAATPEPEPQPTPTPRAEAPAAAPAVAEPSQDGERIVRTVRRPRAGLGLSSRETTTVATTKGEPQPPSADDLDNLTDAQLAELYSGVRRARLTSRR